MAKHMERRVYPKETPQNITTTLTTINIYNTDKNNKMDPRVSQSSPAN